jgi:hypothetical protein
VDYGGAISALTLGPLGFFNLCDELTSTETDQFLQRLAKTKEQWQVGQASLSIRIYQYFIKTRQTTAASATIDDKQQWQRI